MNTGDTVLVAGNEELVAILDVFCPGLECIKPLTIHDIADQYATILDVVHPPESDAKVDDFAVLILEEGQDFVLPFSAFRKVNVQVDELEESLQGLNIPISKSNPGILSQETFIVQTVAAECIQTAYR